jgi:hypothetical protein
MAVEGLSIAKTLYQAPNAAIAGLTVLLFGIERSGVAWWAACGYECSAIIMNPKSTMSYDSFLRRARHPSKRCNLFPLLQQGREYTLSINPSQAESQAKKTIILLRRRCGLKDRPPCSVHLVKVYSGIVFLKDRGI